MAHLAFFRAEFVDRRNWMSEKDYADLVALCQFLPGPASSQVGLAVGYYRHSYGGALAAWLGFTLPSALLMVLFAIGINHYEIPAGALLGLKLVAIAVVAQAIWGMGRSFCSRLNTFLIAFLAALILVFFPNYMVQLATILLGAIVGRLLFKGGVVISTEQLDDDKLSPKKTDNLTTSRSVAILLLSVFIFLLLGLPILVSQTSNQELAIFDIFYRVGSLVFGGGHVVLPMLQAELVPQGLVSSDQFLAGYGAVQAVPGPLFTFAGFLGATTTTISNPWLGGLLCLLAIFLPSFLLVFACLPYWDTLRKKSSIQQALTGANAAVVGILAAAFVNPLLIKTVSTPLHIIVTLLAFIALQKFKLPPWAVVIVGALFGALVFR